MIKKVLIMMLMLVILFYPIQAAAESNEDIVWNLLLEKTQDEKVAAGIMGFFWRESNFIPDSVPFWYNINRDVRGALLKKIRNVNRDTFIKEIQQAGGFGIGQWYAEDHLKNFYYYFNENEYEYDNLEAQVKFTIWEMKSNKWFWEGLYSTKDAYYAGMWIAVWYDGADADSCGVISSLANMVYKERVVK